MISFLQILLLGAAGFFIVYLTALSILALFARERRTISGPRQRRFAVVVPAHNEELSIARTLESLLSIDYPQDSYDVIVVADNCTDATAAIARAAGAKVYERSDITLRGKGYALRWCFDAILNQQPSYDGIVVIDADSVASVNFLSVMNFYLDRGAGAFLSELGQLLLHRLKAPDGAAELYARVRVIHREREHRLQCTGDRRGPDQRGQHARRIIAEGRGQGAFLQRLPRHHHVARLARQIHAPYFGLTTR